MSSLEEIRDSRKKKLEILKKKGINPYPISVKRTNTNKEAIEKFSSLEKKKSITLVGRVMSLRPHGGLLFFNINDGEANFQALLKEDTGGKEVFDLFNSLVDIGDFVSVTGKLFVTKRGEKTLEVRSFQMLTKSLLPLPEKWHGLTDTEERFRKRYLDTISTPEVKERFLTRAKIISEIRRFLDKEGFVEVETPVLQSQAGGATALPFKTHHNALDIDLYLRIAPELYLKQLLIGGFPKVYEIGRNFRNEGIDVTHNPEFTMLEYYEAFSDAESQMKFVEKLLKYLVKKISDNQSIKYTDSEIDFSKKFARITYANLLKIHAGINNLEDVSKDELLMVAEKSGVKINPNETKEKITDAIYKKFCRPKVVQPTFVTDYPVAMLPLAKRSEKNPNYTDAFQLLVGGLEMVKAFSELNDPIDQRERFKKEDEAKKAGDLEAQSSDEAFLEALEHGMPPAGGVGIGIDRLVMLFSDTKNIREVIIFPTLRPKGIN